MRSTTRMPEVVVSDSHILDMAIVEFDAFPSYGIDALNARRFGTMFL